MSLIEGIGDEVTILVTVIVAVTTVVAAWFSTSVTEQQTYWQDQPGSAVDPEPPSQQSTTYSEDSIQDVISEAFEAVDRLADGDFNGAPTASTVESITRTLPSGSDPGIENQGAGEQNVVVEEQVISCSSNDTAANLKSEAGEYEQREKQNDDAASRNSSFECIEAASDVLKSSTLESSEGFNDGVSTCDVVEERVENLHIHSEEQSVRRRHIPSTTTERAESQTTTDQSEPPSSTDTTDGQSERESQGSRVGNQPQLRRNQAASGVITIKLRFVDETERIVSTNMADTLGNFRRETFSSELQSGQTVRLISNGQLLSEDSRTLSSYGLTNQQVVHCQISHTSPRSQQGNGQLDPGDGEFDLGRYMVPLFACILAFMWYLRFQYRYMFNATSTLSLTAVTIVFLLALLAVWRA